MQRILLADIGNTCIKLGLADTSGLGETWSLPTRMPHTADSLGLALAGLLGGAGLGRGRFRGLRRMFRRARPYPRTP